MKTAKLILILPLILVGFVVGFIWEALYVGVCAGKESVCKAGDNYLAKHNP